MRSTIITKGIDAGQSWREYITERMDAVLAHAQDSIHFITVRLSDMNGPKGGVDKRCQIHVKPMGLPAVIVTEVSASVSDAIDGAMQRAAKVIKRVMERANDIPAINVPVLRRIGM